MAKRAFSILVSFLLLVCVWAENIKVGRVNLASFKWKDAKDNKNCSALELGKSSSTVMHIQGKCSPYRLPNSTWWRAISESIKGDNQRYRAMMKGGWSVGKSTVNPQEDADLPLASGQAINTGNYIIKLGFGTPVQISYSVLGTGNIIAWIHCNPCSSCSSGLQLFKPSKSSTYKYFTCASQECQSLGLCENNSNDVNCSFGQIYGDQSEVDELLSSETLSVGSPPVEDFVFGCANAVSGLIQRLLVPGLVGFGRDPLSFVSQTDTLYDSTLSYCLPSLFSSAFTGSLLLGKGALSATGLQFTPLLSNARYPYFYYVGLNGISVGEELVSMPEGTFTLDQATGRGSIIDSGTVITRLVEPAYNAMRDSFRRQLSNLTLASPSSPFDTCYNKPSGKVEFPLITLHFDDSLDFTPPLDNILYPGNEDGSVLCLAFSLPPGGGDAVSAAKFSNCARCHGV
ncbi:hypothetical protein SUGI_0229070 [Cryptomeria japonica]|uniref:aspartyl protease AED3-like n=1 Tax=Cryptomeria japonica TaxID=3369 RepID=UPI00240895D7|nr:aspartyl protease AED3-like [Cryptomeria japonica]GLJ14251.1 hypothetical protein SUGI_0229070 [Cryptomeria japonica]